MLYAVAPADPQATPRHEVDIVLEVGTGMTSEAWRFAIAGNNVVELWISRSWASVLYGPYENYLVLPSRLAPPPEAGHALDPDLHVSDPGVDRLLQALIQRDTKALAAAVLYDGNGTIRSEQCTPSRPRIQPLDPRSVEVELTQITTRAGGVHSIINVPEGAVPPAKHLIVISIDKGHGEWVDAGLLEANGQIVGISLAGCVIMPPLRFLVAPLESRPGTTPEPRTGITYVDRAIDAYEAGDREAIRAAFIFRSIRCTTDPNGSDGPPRCRADEPPGTPVAMASFASCEGYYTRADEIDGFLNYITAPGVAWRLGAILDVGPPTENGRFFGESTIALLEPTRSDQERGTIALLFSSRGVSAVWSGCGVEPTLARLARFGQSSAHDYLLAPPPKR
ncbi:MAG: hypothetical protein DWI48_04345 [Chloroflexi bacterium]|nr:MAG: hypothetical protein DWI48_04345 [Chloroflexota bacterium]